MPPPPSSISARWGRASSISARPAPCRRGSPRLVDNPDTWLRFTDLVFIDPVGTGFSRTEGGGEEHYWGVKQDLETLENFIRQWSQANGRSQSPKYLVGESYGGFRAAMLPSSLATDRGIAITGVVLVSPALEFRFLRGDWLDPLPDAFRLPSFAAVHLERDGRLSPEALREAEEFALGDYLLAPRPWPRRRRHRRARRGADGTSRARRRAHRAGASRSSSS